MRDPPASGSPISAPPSSGPRIEKRLSRIKAIAAGVAGGENPEFAQSSFHAISAHVSAETRARPPV
jgi:hypothetical protein